MQSLVVKHANQVLTKEGRSVCGHYTGQMPGEQVNLKQTCAKDDGVDGSNNGS